MGVREIVAAAAGDRAAAAMRALNARHPWNHNDHFHSWILANLPAERARSLDVGCGRGRLLAALAPHMREVLGVDADAEMRRAARLRCADLPGVVVEAGPWEQAAGPFDLITMVAVLHHLELEAALTRSRELLAPGGRLLVVGLAVPRTAVDQAWDAAGVITNPLIGWVKHPWPRPAGSAEPSVLVADPTLTFGEVRTAAERILPGVRMRHRLGFRCTLAWQKP